MNIINLLSEINILTSLLIKMLIFQRNTTECDEIFKRNKIVHVPSQLSVSNIAIRKIIIVAVVLMKI